MIELCQHLDYDDYFERCGDCGKTAEQIHEDECVPAGFEIVEIDEGLHGCNRCQLELPQPQP